MVCIRVNGETRSLADAVSVAELLQELDLAPGGVVQGGIAVEVNRTIVPRSSHGERVLAEGDEVEIVTIMGGG